MVWSSHGGFCVRVLTHGHETCSQIAFCGQHVALSRTRRTGYSSRVSLWVMSSEWQAPLRVQRSRLEVPSVPVMDDV